MEASLIPKQEQPVTLILNHTKNDPFNKPSVIKVYLLPEEFNPSQMELDYRYFLQDDDNKAYHTRTLVVNRNAFPKPTKENDIRFAIHPATFQRFKVSLENFKKADKNAFLTPTYKWEKTIPLFDECAWNQFALDSINNRHLANELLALRSYR